MRRVFTRVIFLISALFLSACIYEGGFSGNYSLQTDDCNISKTPLGGSLIWEELKNKPVLFYVHESVPDVAQEVFNASIDHWNVAWELYLEDKGEEPFPLFEVIDRELKYTGTPGRDQYNILFFIDKNFLNYEKEEVQAFTAVLSSRRGAIKDTDIIVNNEYYSYYYDLDYQTDIQASLKSFKQNRKLASSRGDSSLSLLKQKLLAWLQFFLKPFLKKKPQRQVASPAVKVPRGMIDFASLMIHELGHVPGLTHYEKNSILERELERMASTNSSSGSDNYVSVMEKKLQSGRARRNIKERDLYNIYCTYIESLK